MQYKKKSDEEGGSYTVAWKDIATNWFMVDNDLYSEYGLDCDGDYINTKTWPWLKHRILGLLSVDSRITRWAQSQVKG